MRRHNGAAAACRIFRRAAVLCLFAALTLTACSPVRREEPDSSTVNTAITTAAPTTAATTAVPAPRDCSPLAAADYLDPDNSSSPREYPPECIMLHFTSAVVLSRDDPYNAALVRGIFADNPIGIHYLIDRAGGIRCFVPETRAAWHAGRGQWKEERFTDKLNAYSIGIELMGIGTQEEMAEYLTAAEYRALDQRLIGFTDAQYRALDALLADLCGQYAIPRDREHIIGHHDYAADKTDPGQLLNWGRIIP